MQKSPLKQYLLCAALGPLGLLFLSPVACISVTMLTANAVFRSPQVWHYILAASWIGSLLLSHVLVQRHNRNVVKNFEFSTHIGSVSCRRYDFKSENKFIKATGYFLLILGITGAGLMSIPDVRKAVSNMNFSAFSETESSDFLRASIRSIDGSIRQSDEDSSIQRLLTEPEDDVIASSLSATEYQTSSDVWYRPKLKLFCESKNYSASFVVDEILGTENIILSMQVEGSEKVEMVWQLSKSYREATTNSSAAINLLQKADAISISYRPFGSEIEKTAVFDLQASPGFFEDLEARCAQQSF